MRANTVVHGTVVKFLYASCLYSKTVSWNWWGLLVPFSQICFHSCPKNGVSGSAKQKWKNSNDSVQNISV